MNKNYLTTQFQRLCPRDRKETVRNNSKTSLLTVIDMSKKSCMDIIFIVVCVCMSLTKYAKCTTLGQGYELGKKLPMTPVMVLEKIGQQMCFKECEAYGACLSINYNRGQLVCELNSGRQNNNLSLINDDDYVYKEIPRAVRSYNAS